MASSTSDSQFAVHQFLMRFLSPAPQELRAVSRDWQRSVLKLNTPECWPDQDELALHCLHKGEGPAILLVHGWQGQAADLLPLAAFLASEGFSVYAPELPGHGASEGKLLSLPLAGSALLASDQSFGPFKAVIAHSFGGAAAIVALKHGLRAERAVLIAPPTHYGNFLRFNAKAAQLDDSQIAAAIAELKRITGVDPDDLTIRKNVEAFKWPALFIHGEEDSMIPLEPTRRASEAWPGARFLSVPRSGHFRVLKDRAVWSAVADFIDEGQPT